MEVIPGCLHKDPQTESLHLEPQHQEVEKAIMMFQQWLQLELTKLQLAPLSVQAMFIAWCSYINLHRCYGQNIALWRSCKEMFSFHACCLRCHYINPYPLNKNVCNRSTFCSVLSHQVR
ncbi:unnamed protein product [Sphagnum jensenii]|uniref:Uncharacterized protein n=1 Tax=Sphagnum jensenii TaxID=128206 RepID=A0ABP1ANB0_9BRYO